MAEADDVSSAGLDEQRDHGGSSGGGSHGVGSRTGEHADEWLQNVLRALADTQRQLAGGKVQGGGRRNLAKISIEDFYGGGTVTTHHYRMFNKHVSAVQKLHGLMDSELALVLYTQVKGKAKQSLEILDLEDLEKDDGLAMVWKIMDQSHEKMEHERADDAYENWESARRKHAQSMDEWILYLKKVKMELETQDATVVISDKQHASKMLCGAKLPNEKRAQVLLNCGGDLRS